MNQNDQQIFNNRLAAAGCKVTLKWHNNCLYVWPGNVISRVAISNGLVTSPISGRVFYGPSAWGLLGRLPNREQKWLQEGGCFVYDGRAVLKGICL